MSPYARLCTASDRAYEHSRPTYSTRCCRLWHILVPMAPAVCGTFRHSNLKSATGSIVRIVERILKVMKLLHRMLSTPVLFIGWYKMARAMYITVFFVDQNNLIHVAFHVDWQTNKQTDRQTDTQTHTGLPMFPSLRLRYTFIFKQKYYPTLQLASITFLWTWTSTYQSLTSTVT